MIKRILFFLLYVSVFIAIPVCVYLFCAVNRGDTAVSQDSLSPDTAALVQDYTDYLGEVLKVIYAIYAALICFLVSILFSFFISLHKFTWPKNKTGGVAIAICIFNFFYLPLFTLIFFSKIFFLAAYAFYPVFGLLTTPFGIGVAIFVALLYVTTIIFTITGIVRGKRIEKIIPTVVPFEVLNQ